jgi:hypothetical protein
MFRCCLKVIKAVAAGSKNIVRGYAVETSNSGPAAIVSPEVASRSAGIGPLSKP